MKNTSTPLPIEPEPPSKQQPESEPEPEGDRQWSSETLAIAIKNMDEKAIIYLFETKGRQFFGWIVKNGGNVTQGKEILQEALIATVEAIYDGRYKENGIFEFYFFKVAINIFYKSFKISKKRQFVETNYYTFHQDETVDPIQIEVREMEFIARLKKANIILDKLTIEQRQVFLLRVDKIPFKQIASILGKSVNSVKMLHSRTNQKIKNLITKS